MYVTVLAVQLRRKSYISATSPGLETVARKIAREMGAMPESTLRSNLISAKSKSELRAAGGQKGEAHTHVSEHRSGTTSDEAIGSSS